MKLIKFATGAIALAVCSAVLAQTPNGLPARYDVNPNQSLFDPVPLAPKSPHERLPPYMQSLPFDPSQPTWDHPAKPAIGTFDPLPMTQLRQRSQVTIG